MDMEPAPEHALTAAAMREADRRTIEDVGIPGHTLMETAARGAVRAMERRWGDLAGRRVAVLCGGGNNGGDGLVMARVLHARGARVEAALFTERDRLKGDAALNLRILQTLASADPDGLRVVAHDALDREAPFDLVVDALLGTGLTSPPRPPMDAAVSWMNARRFPVVAVDLPSGLHTDTGVELGEAVRAALTVTMGAPKTGLLLGGGPALAGEVVTVEIGIPAHVLREEAAGPGCARITNDGWVGGLLAGLPTARSKYDSGPTLVAGGSVRYAAAPVMAARAAARIGSGYVVCAAPEPAGVAVRGQLLEIPFEGLPADGDGFADAARAAERLGEAWPRTRALLVGPGLGRTDGVRSFVRALLEKMDPPAVVDADGLNAIDGRFAAERAAGRWILTPHAAEFERLGGPTDDRSPIVRAAEAAAAWNAIVLLKGIPSVVAAPDGRAAICGTGNAALATAGTGDVLSGFCAGLLARGLDPFEAAVCAVHLGGAAADRYAERSGSAGMMATDLIRQVGLVLRERFE